MFQALDTDPSHVPHTDFDDPVAAALDGGCPTLCSEDMQHGVVLEKALQVQNPFPSPANPWDMSTIAAEVHGAFCSAASFGGFTGPIPAGLQAAEAQTAPADSPRLAPQDAVQCSWGDSYGPHCIAGDLAALLLPLRGVQEAAINRVAL